MTIWDLFKEFKVELLSQNESMQYPILIKDKNPMIISIYILKKAFEKL